MSDKDLFKPYDFEACEVCGTCLSTCPVMELPLTEAKREMEAMRSGEQGRHVLSRCESCFACNLACPNGANPAQLFLARFGEHYDKHSLPPYGLFFQPYQEHNFRQVALDGMPEDERQMVESWKDESPVEEFLYPGCNLTATAYLTRTSLLAGLPIRGGMDYCCGETLYRTGLHDHLRQNAARLDAWIRRLGARRMHVLCNAGTVMFTRVLPRFGFTSDVEIVPMLPRIHKRLMQGEIPVVKKLGMKLTIQESCYAKVLGPDYADIPREICEAIGVEVVEMEHCRERSFCCGIGGGFPAKSGYNPFRIIGASARVLSEARRTGADGILAYCSGCLIMLSTMRMVVPTFLPVYHLLELIAEAAGEPVERRITRRALTHLLGTMRYQFPKLLSGGRVRMKEIEPLP